MRKYILLFALSIVSASLFAQVQLSGRVTGEGDAPLDAVALVVGDDQRFGTTTDAQGRYQLTGLRAGIVRLRLRYVGYEAVDTLLLLIDGANTCDIRMRPTVVYMSEAEVTALRAGERAPFAQSRVTQDDIRRMNTGVDIPVLLELQPSMVTTTDAGTGIGYTGMRIRGSDATRINVTLNGVPVNDAESQAVFWVNMPDLASGLEDVEVQRGVGSSTNGPGAFGASVNMRTTSVQREAFGELALSGGSFNTLRATARFGTGLIQERFSLDGRLSSITSDGFIDRATADMKSWYLQGAWMGAQRSLRLIAMSGHQVTYQAWEGVPREVLDTNRTFNPYTYDNQVDDYRQTHYQLLFDQRVGANGALNITLFRVDGAGYFEQFREQDELARYGIGPIFIGDTTLTEGDVIRRRWLDNTLLGTNLFYEHRMGAHRLVVGGSYSEYRGDHFGEVIWAQWAGDSEIRQRYYTNDAVKRDGNAFAKLTYAAAERLRLFGDVQLRSVAHDFLGYNNALENVTQDAAWTFFNPKAGAEWLLTGTGRVYASVAMAHREPNRSDLVESTPQSRPKPERMIDYELGYTQRGARFSGGVNVYYMDYTDQLVLTGALNDVGYALRTNVPNSHRTGVELTWAARATKRITWKGNLTLSRNIIENFSETLYDEVSYAPVTIDHGTTEIAFSPSVIAGSELVVRLWDDASHGHADLSLLSKYVGRQFLDNTASPDRALDPFFVNDLRLNVALSGLKGVKRIDLNLTVRNLFSELYENNGWVYSTISDGRRNDYVSLFPQAPVHVFGGVTLNF
ncbi:MAG: TonB-dependent receptor [Flavobacteriales bacterium]|nr:TonB-dependent receptor [Flavobacteriales bacterium]